MCCGTKPDSATAAAAKSLLEFLGAPRAVSPVRGRRATEAHTHSVIQASDSNRQ